MKDIDFDELDRAVSSVLGQKVPADQADKTASVTPAPGKSEHDSSVAVSSGFNSAVNAPQDTNLVNDVDTATDKETTPSEKPRVAMPLAAKRRGRFMDVMHPSATGSSGPVKPSPVHVTTKIEPLVTDTETVSDTEPAVEPAPEPTEPTADLDDNVLVGAEPAPVDSELPATSLQNPAEEEHPGSHLLEATYDDTENQEQTPSVVSSDVETEEQDDTEPTSEAEEPASASNFANSVPQATPFLADAQVDKRPLGGGPVTSVTPTHEPNVPADAQNAPVVPLPRELQPDVVQVESVQEEDEPAATVASSRPFGTNVKEAPASKDDGRVEGHPLFDTSTYHEPIAAVHSDSSMPGWAKWLLGLLFCLAVGAGVGYFLFMAGL